MLFSWQIAAVQSLGCVTAWCWHQPPSSWDDELWVCLHEFNTIWFLCICHSYWGLCMHSGSLLCLLLFPIQHGRRVWLAPCFSASTSRAVNAHSPGHCEQAKETAEGHLPVICGPYLLLLLQSMCLPHGSVLHIKMWCWIIPMGSTQSCVTPRLSTPLWGCKHTSENGVQDGLHQDDKLKSWRQTKPFGVHDQPCHIHSKVPRVCLCFPDSDRAKPDPAFLHSQLLKAGNKADIAPFLGGLSGNFQGLQLEHCLPSKWSRHQGTSWDSPCRIFSCLVCCPHACQGGTVPASLLPTPCHWQPSQCYCYRAPTSCNIFTHSFMEVSVKCSHCDLFGQSLLCLENKTTSPNSLNTPGSIYPQLVMVRGTVSYQNCTANILCPAHTCTTYLWMPEIRSCPIWDIWSVLICTNSNLGWTSEVETSVADI